MATLKSWNGTSWVSAAFTTRVGGAWVSKPAYVRVAGAWVLIGGAPPATGVNRRRSAIQIFQVPDGSFDAGDRRQLLGIYRRDS